MVELFSSNGGAGLNYADCTLYSIYILHVARRESSLFCPFLDSFRSFCCSAFQTGKWLYFFMSVLFSYLHKDKMEVAENLRCEDELLCSCSSSGRRLAPGCFSFWLLHDREQIHLYCLTAQTVNMIRSLIFKALFECAFAVFWRLYTYWET